MNHVMFLSGFRCEHVALRVWSHQVQCQAQSSAVLYLLTREEQPQLPSHALRYPFEDQVLRLFSAVHAHSLSKLSEMVLPGLLL